jgi:hypothetical protein
MWIEIILKPEQQQLAQTLQQRLPNMQFKKRGSDGRLSFTAYLPDGAECIQQLNYLRGHDILLIDLEREREQAIHQFFYGVEIDGMEVTHVLFPDVVNERLTVVLQGRGGDEFLLRFPPNWRMPIAER